MKQAGRKDYEKWVTEVVTAIEAADNAGDSTEVSRLVKKLTGGTSNSHSKQPNVNKQGGIIKDSAELGALWQDFLAEKFSATELEAARAQYSKLPAKQQKVYSPGKSST